MPRLPNGGIRQMKSNADYILVVENQAMFNRLINSSFANMFGSCILFAGSGFPDTMSREILHDMVEELQIPVYGLFDEIHQEWRFSLHTDMAQCIWLLMPNIW